MTSILTYPPPPQLLTHTPPGKPKLHLVVLGHVDAGKSTLMGRMLYELGLLSDKAVHKAQRDAAAAGKVGAQPLYVCLCACARMVQGCACGAAVSWPTRCHV